jgi:hypothetical protein
MTQFKVIAQEGNVHIIDFEMAKDPFEAALKAFERYPNAIEMRVRQAIDLWKVDEAR